MSFNQLSSDTIEIIFSYLYIRERYRVRGICKYSQIVIDSGKIYNSSNDLCDDYGRCSSFTKALNNRNFRATSYMLKHNLITYINKDQLISLINSIQRLQFIGYRQRRQNDFNNLKNTKNNLKIAIGDTLMVIMESDVGKRYKESGDFHIEVAKTYNSILYNILPQNIFPTAVNQIITNIFLFLTSVNNRHDLLGIHRFVKKSNILKQLSKMSSFTTISLMEKVSNNLKEKLIGKILPIKWKNNLGDISNEIILLILRHIPYRVLYINLLKFFPDFLVNILVDSVLGEHPSTSNLCIILADRGSHLFEYSYQTLNNIISHTRPKYKNKSLVFNMESFTHNIYQNYSIEERYEALSEEKINLLLDNNIISPVLGPRLSKGDNIIHSLLYWAISKGVSNTMIDKIFDYIGSKPDIDFINMSLKMKNNRIFAQYGEVALSNNIYYNKGKDLFRLICNNISTYSDEEDILNTKCISILLNSSVSLSGLNSAKWFDTSCNLPLDAFNKVFNHPNGLSHKIITRSQIANLISNSRFDRIKIINTKIDVLSLCYEKQREQLEGILPPIWPYSNTFIQNTKKRKDINDTTKESSDEKRVRHNDEFK